MKRATALSLALMMVACVAACARQPRPNVPMIRVPPRIDLTQHELIGVIPVASTSSSGELGPLATRRLMDFARQDQGLVRMVEFGAEPETPRPVAGRWNPEKVKAFGRDHGLATILTGEIVVSNARPDVRIAPSLKSGSVTALVEVSLSVQLLETATGASIWSNSARVTQNVGHVGVFNGKDITFDAQDPEAAYGPLVDALVEQVTRDFRATWQQG